MSNQNETHDVALNLLLEQWKEEQYMVASEVIIPEENNTNYQQLAQNNDHFVITNDLQTNNFYGGVDISFPQKEGDDAVAVYVILRDREVVYQDYEFFKLSLPYISSYLSFREIEPLERLVKKQVKNQPKITPSAILVDGNRVHHARRAGLACFLGVRTGLTTIGVGKSLYCQDGLTKQFVLTELEKKLNDFWEHWKPNGSLLDDPSSTDSEKLVISGTSIDARFKPHGSETVDNLLIQKNEICSPSLKDKLVDMKLVCVGYAAYIQGESGTIWATALLGHGGRIAVNGKRQGGTKNPIFVSIGHNISLQDATIICSQLSLSRIPEPIRTADLIGRRLMCDMAEINHSSKMI